MANKPMCPKCNSNAWVDGPYNGYWNWYCEDCRGLFHYQPSSPRPGARVTGSERETQEATR